MVGLQWFREKLPTVNLPLCILFTKSLNAGSLPTDWKKGCVTRKDPAI